MELCAAVRVEGPRLQRTRMLHQSRLWMGTCDMSRCREKYGGLRLEEEDRDWASFCAHDVGLECACVFVTVA